MIEVAFAIPPSPIYTPRPPLPLLPSRVSDPPSINSPHVPLPRPSPPNRPPRPPLPLRFPGRGLPDPAFLHPRPHGHPPIPRPHRRRTPGPHRRDCQPPRRGHARPHAAERDPHEHGRGDDGAVRESPEGARRRRRSVSKVRIVIIIVAVIAGIFSAARRNHTAPGVVSVKPKDPRRAAAIKEALDRWPEFEAAFNEHKPGRACEVKYGFRIREDGGGTEFIWVDVASISGTKITSTVDNQPPSRHRHKT